MRDCKPSRNDIQRDVSDYQKDYERLDEPLKETSQDVVTLRETMDALHGEGTVEADEAAQECLEHGQEATANEFDEHDTELERIQDEAEHFEDTLDAREHADQEDLTKINDGQRDSNRQGARDGHSEAADLIDEDIQFLRKEREECQENREASKEARDIYFREIQAARSG